MSLPYFPMFPTDFEAKTSHLTLEEDGAYNRLLRLMWMTPGCSLPDDDAWIARRMRVDADTYERVVLPVIEEFCERKNGRVSNARLTRVFNESSTSHKKRVEAGKRGGAAKAAKYNDNAPRNAKAKPKQPEPEPDIKKEHPKGCSKEKRGTRLPDDWTLPDEWKDWALSQQWPEASIRLEADKFADFWRSKSGRDATKLDWQMTWRNWMRNSKAPRLIDGRGPPAVGYATQAMELLRQRREQQ